MRKKILISVGIFILFVSTIFNIALADDNDGIIPINENLPVDSNNMVIPINNELPTENNIVGTDEIKQQLYFNAKNIAEENLYGFKKKITIDEKTINGNVFLFAETVELKNVTINGDVVIFASRLDAFKEANLNGNVFIFASNVNLDSKIARELYVLTKDIVFGENTTVMYNNNIAANHVDLKGTFYRNVNVTVEKFEVNDNSVVLGNLNYVSEKEATIAESAVITNINFSKFVEKERKLIDIIVEQVLDFSRYFILIMVVFIVIMKYLPNVIEKSKKNLSISSFGIGIGAVILVPIMLILLLMLHVFTSLVFAILALCTLVLMISNAITNIAIAKVISDKNESFKLPLVVAIITVINWIIYQIPMFGGIIAFIWIITGLGISVRNCFK